MQEDKLYDTLLNLPLFLGMSRADLLQIAGHTKFDFQKIEGGETLTEIGEPYHRLLFLLSGEVAVETMADDRGYRIVETIKAPEVFMIERLFGYDQHSPHHYVARNDCSLMSISKKEVLRLAKQYEIFHINLLNLISTQAQRSNRRLFRVPPKTLSDSIIRFFENHCLRPAGEKSFYIKMDRLAQELATQRTGTRLAEQMAASGAELLLDGPGPLAARVAREVPRWKELVASARISIE